MDSKLVFPFAFGDDVNAKRPKYMSLWGKISNWFQPKTHYLFMAESSDPHTGLINRKTLCKVLQDSPHPGVVFAIDLHTFKQINERYGYDVGDSLLTHVGEELYAFCERMSRFDGISLLPAKSAGEKFILFCRTNITTEKIWEIARQIEMMFDGKFDTSTGPLQLQAYIGISDGSGAKTAEDTYAFATLAMQDAKAKQNRITWFCEHLYQTMFREKKIIAALQDPATASQFHLVFQAKIDLSTRNHSAPCAYEALIRWHSASLGVISPGEFIPIAEANHLIRQIDNWVLNETIKSIAVFFKDGNTGIQISCNISSESLIWPGLTGMVKDLLHSHQIPPHSLQLEVTEHSLIADVHQAVMNLNALKNMGVSIALDDFGTGYSSLGCIRDLPIDTLKIDRTFLSGIHDDPKRKSLLQHVISLGRSLDLDVVIEGVENPLDVALIESSAASYAQGYAYAMPLRIEQILHCKNNDPH